MATALLMSAGCWWGQPGAGPGNTFANFDETLTVGNVATLQQVWSGRGGLSAVVDGKVIGASGPAAASTWSRTTSPPAPRPGLRR